jgi:hypothetical protein
MNERRNRQFIYTVDSTYVITAYGFMFQSVLNYNV